MIYPTELTQTYEIYEQIGAGGGGTVYRAVHKRLKKTVVIKKLKGTASKSIQECRTEVDILKKLKHSYLPQVIDFIDSSEGIFTVMDFIPGKSLQDMLDEKHSFTEQEVLKYTRQLCEALDYLHSQNPPIIHGDIKPDNIMITPEGNVCLIDFNISAVLEGREAITFVYTKGYSAPEQAVAFEQLKVRIQQEDTDKTEIISADDKTEILSDDDKTELLGNSIEKTVLLGNDDATEILLEIDVQKEVALAAVEHNGAVGISIDKRSDVYSLGATIYSLLTGKIYNPNGKKLLLSNVSSGFSVVLGRALAFSPEKRYQDAGVMLQAVLAVHKKDKKYRRLLLRQELTLILFFALLAASIYCVVEGKNQMEMEKEEHYERVVEDLQLAVEQGTSYEEFETMYEEAISLFPQQMDAYYVKAVYLYNHQGVEVTTEYISEVMSTPLQENEELRGNLYYLYGDCFFQKEKYAEAAFYYERAINYTPSNGAIYRDYAIALAYQGKSEEAEKLLREAASYGLTQTDIQMVQGELLRMAQQYEEALTCFQKVITQTKDEYMKQRAYIMASKTFETLGTKDALDRDTEWLKEAVKELDSGNRILVYERLVQDYISLGEMTKNKEYYYQAIEVMKEIISMNWDSYLTYSNIVVLYQRIGDMEEALNWAKNMCKEYPDHYISYMRLAFSELEVTNAELEASRDYGEFLEYYWKAKECYQKQMSGNVTNSEMLLLENAYQQLIDGNWIKE